MIAIDQNQNYHTWITFYYEMADNIEGLPKSVRIDLAHQAWKDANGQLSMRKAAGMYQVSLSTLQGRIKGAVSKLEANQAMQRLSVAEEEAIRDWMLQSASEGRPVRVKEIRSMASEMLKEKGDTAGLGIHWTDQFLQRYPDLKTKYIAGRDKKGVGIQDSA